jgi:hypothetical protein
MPATSVRDIIVHDDDLIAATHGRGFWILDNITPLRQMGSAGMYKPQTAVRVRWNMNTDTPLPPDEPASKNPPDGAILDYYLGAAATGPATLEILDAGGAVVRKYSSADPVPETDPMFPVPTYWIRPHQGLETGAGMHRFLWDMKYTPLPAGGGRGGLPIAAIAHDTAPAPNSIWAAPGRYTVKLTVDGKSYSQPLTVRMDPRVKTPPAGLQQQFTLSKQLYDDALAVGKALEQIRAARGRLGTLEAQVRAIEGAVAGGGRGAGRGAAPAGPETLNSALGSLSSLIQILQAADVTPPTQMVAAVAGRHAAVARLIRQWNSLRAQIKP